MLRDLRVYAFPVEATIIDAKLPRPAAPVFLAEIDGRKRVNTELTEVGEGTENNQQILGSASSPISVISVCTRSHPSTPTQCQSLASSPSISRTSITAT